MEPPNKSEMWICGNYHFVCWPISFYYYFGLSSCNIFLVGILWFVMLRRTVHHICHASFGQTCLFLNRSDLFLTVSCFLSMLEKLTNVPEKCPTLGMFPAATGQEPRVGNFRPDHHLVTAGTCGSGEGPTQGSSLCFFY